MKEGEIPTNRSNRRDFIKKSTLAVSALGAMSTGVLANNISPLQEEDANSEDIKLNLAGYPVNRVKALISNNSYEQGLSSKPLTIEALFDPSSLRLSEQ